MVGRVIDNKYNKPAWLCKCDCGVEKVIAGASLRKGQTKSCGCLQKELLAKQNRLGLGVAMKKLVMRTYKVHAEKKGLEFNLTEKEFFELTQQDCYYCRSKPNNETNRKNCYGNYIYSGIDRVDNSKGYTIDNVVPCCKFCNKAKNDFTLQEFKDWIKKVYNNLWGDD